MSLNESQQLALIAIDQAGASLRSLNLDGAGAWLDAAQTYLAEMGAAPVQRPYPIILAVGEWPDWVTAPPMTGDEMIAEAMEGRR